MAFWKMAGLEVAPRIPSSIIRWSSPFFMSSRESSSTQGDCPSSCIFRKRSFTSTSLWGREPSCGPSRQSTPDPRGGTEKLWNSLRPPVVPSDARGLTTSGAGSNPGDRVWSAPIPPDSCVSQLLWRSDVEFRPDEGEEIEEKPHQGVQASVLPAGSHRREASRPDLPRAQPLRERALEMAQGIRSPRRGSIHRKQVSGNEALEARIAELERFCGQLSLENQILKKILKKSLKRMHSPRGTP